MFFFGTTQSLRSSHFRHCQDPSPAKRVQDDTAKRARARSFAPLTPCGAFSPAFSFERRGLNQVGGIPEEHQNLLAQIPYPKAFRVSTSWDLPPERCGSYLTPPPSCWQSNILPNPHPICKYFFSRSRFFAAPTFCLPRQILMFHSRMAPILQ